MRTLEVVLLRHAIAEEREQFAHSGLPDTERPLTEHGRQRMERASRGLQQLLPKVGLIASSPLCRARQTAAIVAAGYHLTPEQLPTLAPGESPQGVADYLERRRADGPLLLVGHEPDLGQLAAWLLAGEGDFIEFKKGGACLLHFAASVEAGAGRLVWALPPKALRAL